MTETVPFAQVRLSTQVAVISLGEAVALGVLVLAVAVTGVMVVRHALRLMDREDERPHAQGEMDNEMEPANERSTP